MKRVNLNALRGAIVMSACLLTAVDVAPQIVGPPQDSECKGSGAVMVTVFDSSGAVIPNAFVLFRADRLGTATAKTKTVPVDLWTNSEGKATAWVPCGYADFFVAADGFTPHSEKMLVGRDISSTSVRLNVASNMIEY